MAVPAFLVHKFDPFDFAGITGHPHDMPTFSIWNEYIPRFNRNEYEDLAQHLQDFHKCMEQQGIFHEDVKMKLFMFSLDQETRTSFRSLPFASITSLKDFHSVFNSSCRIHYPHKFIFEACCEYYHAKETLKAHDDPVEETNDLDENISNIQSYEQVSEREELSFSQNDVENSSITFQVDQESI